jgi:hypothetical protein
MMEQNGVAVHFRRVLGCIRFESCPAHWLSRLVFLVVFSVSPGKYRDSIPIK